MKVDALTGEVKSIIKWPGDSRLIVTAVFRCNTVYLKLIFFSCQDLLSDSVQLFVGMQWFHDEGLFSSVLYTGIIVVQCLTSVKFRSTFCGPSFLKMGRFD